MLPSPEPWQVREGAQCYTLYPAASISRPWQGMCRFVWNGQQLIVPLYLVARSRLRHCIANWEPEQRN